MFKSKAVKNLYSLTIAEIAAKGITFIINAYLARILAVDGYGIITNIYSILFLGTTFTNLGFITLGMRSIATDYANKEKYINNIITIKLVIGLLFYVILCCFVLFGGGFGVWTYDLAILIGGIQFLVSAISIEWFYTGIERMEILGLRSILTNVLTLVGVLLFVHSKEDIPIYMGIVSISLLINNFWLIIFYIRKYAHIHLSFNLEVWKVLLKQSLMLGGITIIVGVMSTFNIYLLTSISGNYETGIFGAAFKLFNLCQIPIYIVLGTFSPQFAQANNDVKSNVINKSMRMTMFVGTFISIVVLTNANFLITTIFGSSFTLASTNLVIFMVDLFIATIAINYITLLNVWKKEKIVLKIYIVALIIFIIFNIILINIMGNIGATFATLITDITLMIMLAKIIKKELNTFGSKIIIQYAAIFVITIALLILSAHFLQINNNILKFVINIILTTIIYLGITLKTKMVTKTNLKQIINR